jgi:hypothetical protein
MVPAVIKPARTLWNEFIGFVFLCLAGIFGIRTIQHALEYSKAPAAGGLGILILGGFVTLIMLWFGLTSLLKARKIARS